MHHVFWCVLANHFAGTYAGDRGIAGQKIFLTSIKVEVFLKMTIWLSLSRCRRGRVRRFMHHIRDVFLTGHFVVAPVCDRFDV